MNRLIWRLRRVSLCHQRYLRTSTAMGTSGLKSVRETFIERVSVGPGLQDFLNVKPVPPLTFDTTLNHNYAPYIDVECYSGAGRKVFFEVYGCQMNTNDTEIVWSILQKHGYDRCQELNEADVIVIVTCAIRDGAEQKIWNRLKHLNAFKERRSTKRSSPLQITVLGCMAERLKHRLLERERCVDVIAGPDSYKDLPRLMAVSRHYQQSAVNVLLSLDETYADVMPVRINSDSRTAFVSIMRGCDNMCTYCIVPFTRGRERSRPFESITKEVCELRDSGVKEVTLLGQNVNSYRDISTVQSRENESLSIAPGFSTVYKPKVGGLRFAELLQKVAEAAPEMRIRFTSPHPKDFSDDVLRAIRDYPNICNNLHLPAQSGNDAVLSRMRRGYTREVYIRLVDRVRSFLPNVGLSSDFICGFCGETEEEFNDTLSLIKEVRYNVAFLFAYSMRERTTAHRKYLDDVPQLVKTERLQRMVKAFREGAGELHSSFEGLRELILIEGRSKRSENCWFGRNDANIKVIIPAAAVPIDAEKTECSSNVKNIEPGDFVAVKINESNSQVLKGVPLSITTIAEFYDQRDEL